MRKIYSLVLMATALLIGTNAWAEGVIEIVRDGVVLPTTYDHLKDAFAAAQDGDILQLTDNMNENEAKAAWLGAPSSGTLDNYANPDSENPLNGYRSITLDLKGHTYYNSGARYVIALTRGKLRIKSTGGEGEIKLKKHGIAVFGTYLKIDAKTQTPFSHLIIDENVKIKEGEKGVVLEVLTPHAATSNVQWADTYSFDYRCDIFPNSNYGIANGARIDIYGKLETTEYACQVSGNVRSALEYLNSNGTYRTTLYGSKNQEIHFPLYWKKSDTELYLPGTNSPDSKTPEPLAAAWSTTAYYDAVVSSSNDYVLTLDDNNYAAYVYIRKSAILKTNNQDVKSAVGFYSAGYSRVYIEGTCEGSTGLYVKSGDVELHDATITSNYSGDYAAAVATGSGVNAGGSGIVIESNKGYTGNIDATVTGDTYVKGSTGYAIDEAVTNAEGTEVDAITITGGTFVGGGQGTLKLDETTVTAAEDPNEQTTISITGGKIDGNNTQTTIQVGDNEIQLTDFLADTQTNTHITYVTDENNNTTMIISEGPAPAEDPGNPGNTTWAFIASQSNSANPPSYAWTAVEQNQQISSGTIYLGELQINSGSAGNLQELIIHDGATLQVERLIMNAYARIIVEAGGKLIVKGTQGISAPSIQNIVLKNEENNPAIFLFNPAVSSNKHPNGTVEFTSKGFNNTATSTFGWQKFGLPTKEWTAIEIENNIQTAFSYFNYEASTPAWTICGWIQGNTSTLDSSKIKAPFEYYEMEHNTATVGTKVTFKGSLVGNDVPELFARKHFWNGYANSYSAPINGDTLLSLIPSPVDKAFYLYTLNAQNKFEWLEVSKLDIYDIQPMQPFLLRNAHDNDAAVEINYGKAVYNAVVNNHMNAATPTAPSAPARRNSANNFTKVKLIVNGEGCSDRVVVAEDVQFSSEFDNGYDVVKYMNEGINMYVSVDEKMAHFATDDLENTYLGFQAVEGGTYTIEFANVQGEELTLIDLDNNASVVMVEGNKYEFTADAKSVNDYRFKIVSTFNAPTAIENTEVVKSAKGIYTITGQYVGEMNVWNSLPAGIYVVNGEKLVK